MATFRCKDAETLIENVLSGKTIDEAINERFSDRSGPDGIDGGSPSQRGGSPTDGNQKTASAAGSQSFNNKCARCGDAMNRLSASAASCPTCGFSSGVGTESFIQRPIRGEGGYGVHNPDSYGYLSVPGGPFQTNEHGRLKVKRVNDDMFEIEAFGNRTKHSLQNAHSAFCNHTKGVGHNIRGLMSTVMEWLYNESESGDEYVWDLTNQRRMVVSDHSGFKAHKE